MQDGKKLFLDGTVVFSWKKEFATNLVNLTGQRLFGQIKTIRVVCFNRANTKKMGSSEYVIFQQQ